VEEDDNWFEDYIDENSDGQIDEYDVTATPNDFNVVTLKALANNASK
jgi:hypothetical protein